MLRFFCAALPLALILHMGCVQSPSVKAPAVQSTPHPCPRCPPDDSTLPGVAMRGTVEKIDSERSTIFVRHGEIPTQLSAATTEFKIEPEVLKTLKPGAEILVRIVERDGQWWVFNVRTLVRVDLAPTGSPSPP